MDELEAAGVAREALLHVNLEEQALMSVMGPELLERLYETYRVEVFPEGRAYLFLDEVQQAPGWERWVRSRNETEDVKIFVTGSSAKLMSPGLSVRSLIQVADEGLEQGAVRTRELRSLERAGSVFPQAKRFLVAGSLPGATTTPAASASPEIRWVPLWRFLTEAGDEARIVEGRPGAPSFPERREVGPEELALRHVRRHGRITRREAAELCGLSRPQASRLLGRLVERGRIVRRGAGGGTWYSSG